MDDRLEELFPFYALGALSDEERAQVDAYVATDPAARARLAEAVRTAAAVPLSAEPVVPRPQNKARLMARVNADASHRADAQRQADAKHQARFDWARLFQTPWFRTALPLVTIASVLIAIGLGVWAASLNADLIRAREETARLQQELLAQRNVLAQIAAPRVQAMSITGTDVQPAAHGQMWADPQATTAVLIVSDLRPLPPDRVYQFWLIRNQVPISGGTFSVDDRGRAVLPIGVSEAVGSFDAMGVSIEPSGGSAQPTGDIVMLSEFAPS